MTGWKTLLFNGGLAALVLAAEILDHLAVVDWRQIVPPGAAPLVVLAIGLANIMLRHVTHGPAGWRGGGRR
ncbi:hypothetical protein [Polymorphum gilvum]|uniref:Uncharacterized protein n=1 Tax=Polymorphum gilvum (strain LMG 25793 / CGMCC 1.9160 / SL003B-26A1) TaxID=991905 RepID=F2J6G5_POLGS|nr:hypothetical protein [Polymorphum gilvum]ADZ71339.1 hypothetical protein SL003B_2916 [Polymorphum gilvum SL003B-26A1]